MSATSPNAATLERHMAHHHHSQNRRRKNRKKKGCCDVHCNSLWSVWYGLLAIALQSYIVYKAVVRFLIYIALPWPDGRQPYLELNLFVGLVGAGVVLVPFYLVASLCKIGNLANDGYKLGYKLSACAMDPPSILARSGGLVRSAWHHGGPTAPFIHVVTAFCFVLPKIFMEARLIDVGFLSQDWIWKTDLDWLVPHQDRLVILNFLTGGAVNATSTTTVAPYHHPAAQIRDYLEKQDAWWPVSPEFLNYGVALTVYAIRYAAVFWNTNKGLAFVFSLQLFANSMQSLLSIGGISVMYKVQLLGPQNVLHKYEPFLLNPPICMLLYLLSSAIVSASSCVVYMYGYHKFMTFVDSEREKHSVVLPRTSLWTYFPHCSAMCVLIALAVCNAPLLYDFTLIYKGSLDGTVLSSVIATILHLFLWIVVWLFLTVKQSWTFKLRVTVGRAAVRSARSIKLLNDVDLSNDGSNKEGEAMMIVAFGKAFAVTEEAPKKQIMNTLARAAIERDKALEDDDGDAAGGDEGQGLLSEFREGADSRLQNAMATSPSIMRHVDNGAVMSPKSVRSEAADSHQNSASPFQRLEEIQQNAMEDDMSDSLPPPPPPPPDEHLPPGSPHHQQQMQQMQQQLQQQQQHVMTMCTSPRPPPNRQVAIIHNPEILEVQTPRSNRSVDSGLPQDDITPRSDSLSTASSSNASPPDGGHGHIGGHGVGQTHLGAHHLHQQQQQHLQHQALREMQQEHRKSSSLDDINVLPNASMAPPPPLSGQITSTPQSTEQRRTSSLQRGTAAPTESPIYGTVNKEGTVAIRRKTSRPVTACPPPTDEEDIYGRLTNMKLSSFAEEQQMLQQQQLQQQAQLKDPRIIDLNLNTSAPSISSQSANSISSSQQTTPRQGSPVQFQQQVHPHPNGFNTLPVNGTPPIPNGAVVVGGVRMVGPHQNATLPARVNGNNGAAPAPRGACLVGGPPSRHHFRPFDHRRMNPMEDIHENPYAVYKGPRQPPVGRPVSAAPVGQPGPGGNLIVQKNMGHLPHLPAELRHTNYAGSHQQQQQQQM